MGITMSSKTKVAFCGSTGELIVDTKKAISNGVEELKSVATAAQYAAADRVYNAVVEISNEFEVVLDKNKKTLTEILTSLTKRTDIGEAFVASAKKALADVEGISGATVYEAITAERDGSETWDKSMQSRMEDAVLAWVKTRNNWIVGLSESFKKIEDPSFKEAILPLCKRNEEFTNSVASNANKIADALNELGISLDKFIGATAETASLASVGAVNVKVDLNGADV